MYKFKCPSHATVEEILAELDALPLDNNKELDMSVRFLNKRDARAQVSRILAKIPLTVEFLNLSVNFLSEFTGAELAEVLKAIPASVEVLELSGNHLFSKSEEELLIAFQPLPAGIKTLGLSYNGLEELSLESIERIFKVLPPHITTLDLRGSNLVDCHISILQKLVSIIPPHIKMIDLRENRLDEKSASDLYDFLTSVCTDTSIDISCPGHPLILKGKKPVESILPAIGGAGVGAVARPATAAPGTASSTTSHRKVVLLGGKDTAAPTGVSPLHTLKGPARPGTVAVQGLFISTKHLKIGSDGKPAAGAGTVALPGIRT